MGWVIGLILAVSPDLAGYEIPPRHNDAIIRGVTTGGQLTIGVDGLGRLAQLRWPSAGHWEHLYYDPQSRAGGAYWFIVEDDTPMDLDPSAWAITHERDAGGALITAFDERAGGRRAVQRITPERAGNRLIIDLTLEGFSPDTECLWYQHLTPATSQIAGIAQSAAHARMVGGFASYYDPEAAMLIQFRPQHPGRADWQQARSLAANGAPGASWSAFGAGTYWGTFATGTALGGKVRPATESLEALIGPGVEADGRAVLGSAHGVLRIRPAFQADGKLGARICLAVAETETALRQRRRAELSPQTHALDPGERNAPPNKPLDALIACLDPASGAIVRAPVGIPALTHAAVFDATWASAGFDAWGHHEKARRALEVHLASVRTAFRAEGPPGSLPAYLATTGDAARFQDQANPASTAWLLAAVWRHVAAQPGDVSALFLDEWEPVLIDMGDFLARAPTVGGVLSGLLKPAAAPIPTLQTHYLGLVSARSLMDRMGRAEPAHWQGRREETYARIRFRQLDRGRIGVLESAWVDFWVRRLPESALENPGDWQPLLVENRPAPANRLLNASQRTGPPIHPDVPLALEAAVALLSTAAE